MLQLFSLMFYHTENLFDTVDDPLSMNDDFPPNGLRQRKERRFNRKAEKLTNVISEIVHPKKPDKKLLPVINSGTDR
ncbi:MAG: hypothetical protein XD92_0499 [Proteiniphilum acetatigenes]|uniref:Endonuclease/exonuclease/phosphatase domain-containing protein n=1 Tax=Proteiniphilum acetatigenes TaxID=294710 RepID=A0A101HJY4_9BACT|nr:MAG: hypothetical protein XD92_0499 [Proteiniphilum acetatigenes]